MRDKRDMRVRDARDTRNEWPRVTLVTHVPQVNLLSRGTVVYQAGACDYRMRTFIGNLRRRLRRPALTATEVPVGMVRDVVLTHYRVPEGF